MNVICIFMSKLLFALASLPLGVVLVGMRVGVGEGALKPPKPVSRRPPGLQPPPPPQQLSASELNGQHLVVSMVDDDFAWYIPSDPNLFRGRDGMVLEAMQQALNFTALVYPPSDGNFSYGSSTSVLTDVLFGQSDLSLNAFKVIPYFLSVRFSPVIAQESTLVLVPGSVRVNAWLSLAVRVAPSVWLLLLGSVVCVAAVWSAASGQPLTKALPVVVHFFTGTPKSRVFHIQRWPMRFLAFFCSLFGFIFGCFFTGILYNTLTAFRFTGEILSLEDLNERNLMILAPMESVADAFYGSEVELWQQLHSKVREYDLVEDWEFEEVVSYLCMQKSIAMLYTQRGMRWIQSLAPPGHQDSMRVLDEPVATYFQAYAMSPDTVIGDAIDNVTGWLLQSGLIDHWSREGSRRSDTNFWLHRPTNIRFQDLQTAFWMACAAYILALGLFAAEVVVGRGWVHAARGLCRRGGRVRRRRPPDFRLRQVRRRKRKIELWALEIYL